MADVKITVRKNGPFRIEASAGAVSLVDADGNEIDLQGKTTFALCRCGHSLTQPFCDGSHKTLARPAGQESESAG
jgi:3-phenylpropionate/trans-cinnamate dioxygenase ferredoxin subunit